MRRVQPAEHLRGERDGEAAYSGLWCPGMDQLEWRAEGLRFNPGLEQGFLCPHQAVMAFISLWLG